MGETTHSQTHVQHSPWPAPWLVCINLLTQSAYGPPTAADCIAAANQQHAINLMARHYAIYTLVTAFAGSQRTGLIMYAVVNILIKLQHITYLFNVSFSPAFETLHIYIISSTPKMDFRKTGAMQPSTL